LVITLDSTPFEQVCSSWNPVVVKHNGQDVAATALCHVSKDSHCYAGPGKSLADIEAAKHTCVSKKALTPQSICYSLAKVDGRAYPGGMGMSCEGGSNPVTDSSVRGLVSNHGAGRQWCCIRNASKLPAWLQSVPAHMWCGAVAMRA